MARRRRDGALASRPVCGEDARGRCRWGGSEKESFSSTRRAFLAVVVVAVVDVRVAALGPRDANPQPRNALAVIVQVLRFGTRHLVCRTALESSGPTGKERGKGARAHLIHDNVAPAFHACASSRRLAVAPRKRCSSARWRSVQSYNPALSSSSSSASSSSTSSWVVVVLVPVLVIVSSAVVQLLLLSNVSHTGGKLIRFLLPPNPSGIMCYSVETRNG